ncbi:unnamed protein product [Polarella glacialis]|uniref:Uncharacterized protein n=1 Tax=Polarella glacialis TaxID=89957 RepID=A0A813IST9_POLGL|nr:unnamed protein product [Polarella glacialis]CAE8660076.1 unnamed protein product [Polarella glacialis]
MQVHASVEDELGTGVSVKRDQYGEIFEDYGFLERAELSKIAGNEAFRKERYEKALSDYDVTLEQLLTVAYDKTITVGRQKWNDVVILRSTVLLNKSTCHYKLKQWQKSLAEAKECLHGNVRDEMLFTAPHIRQKVKESDRRHGHLGVTFVEHRLPRLIGAKAWFRISQCYGHLEYLEKATDALAKALEMCDDPDLMPELAQHSFRIDTLERLQRERQKKQFQGFWDKLQDRGGYAESNNNTEDHWDKLNYANKFRNAEEFEVDCILPDRYSAEGMGSRSQQTVVSKLQKNLPPGVKWDAAMKGVTKKMYSTIDQSFEAYLKKKIGTGLAEESLVDPVLSQGAPPPSIELPPPLWDYSPSRPRVKEEASLMYTPVGGYPGPRTRAARSPSPAGSFDPAEALSRQYAESARQELAWHQNYATEALDSNEELELQQARERMENQRWERLNKDKRSWLEALDDSDDDR